MPQSTQLNEPPCPMDGTGPWYRRTSIETPGWAHGMAFGITRCKQCLTVVKVVPIRLDVWFKVLFGEQE